ncbi:MAG: EAL domain-containing protein [Treponema sp.]|nr:EAL domain-containing protein [Treponema sp.]
METFQKLITKFKHHLKNYNYTPFVKDFFFISNIRSSIYVSVIVAIIEIWMLIMMISGIIKNSENYSFHWLFFHTISYTVLLAISLIMLVYSALYLKGKVSNKRVANFIRILFSLAMIAFALYVSYTSKDRGGQVFAFISVITFINCIFVWNPFVSFICLTGVFAVYIYLQSKIVPITLSIKVNGFTTWLAFLVTALNTHNQKRVESQKDEQLQKMNNYLEEKSRMDELTNLANRRYFYSEASKFLNDGKNDISKICFAYMDLENFKNYNEKYGFQAGTNFLRTVAKIIKKNFKGELVARFSDDHFVVLTNPDSLEQKLIGMQSELKNCETSLQLGFKVGIYRPKDRFSAPNLACDHARYACESIKKHFGHDIVEYNSKMDQKFRLKQHIINNLDSAIENGFIKVFYQPVVWAKNGNLCGVEALARWEDPSFGFLSPAAFIPVLEEYHLIHKLDLYVMRTVCFDMSESKNNGLPAIPASINFSRLDFELANPVRELDECLKKYKLSKEDIHVEITESALNASDEALKSSLENFRKNGNALWLDDFGSGASGLNTLKDFNFDLMKIDMVFLSKFSESEKSQPILSTVVQLAQRIGMQTLTEGVETKEAYDFLKSIGCQRLQGYLFGKPMPKEELLAKIKDGTYTLETKIA